MTKRAGSAHPTAGRCGARLRGKDAGRFCTVERVKGRPRCRNHGGLSPRAAAHPRTTHGRYSRENMDSEIFASPFTTAEDALVARTEADVPASVNRSIGELDVWIERAGNRGHMATVRMLTTAKASLVRAHVSLKELPAADEHPPDLVEMYVVETAHELRPGPHLIERQAARTR